MLLPPLVYTTATPRVIHNPAATLVSDIPNPVARRVSNAHPVPFPLVQAIDTKGATPPPLNAASPNSKTASVPNSAMTASILNGSPPVQRSISMVQQQRSDEDSPVMNETLSVIDEHITDMHLPRPTSREEDEEKRAIVNDSSSEYSSHIEQRLSYIVGNETDEEERGALTEQEVLKWTPSQVAEHLEDIGVEYRHCETFKEQEISGEVLLAMDQPSIFMKEFNLGLVGQRLRTWHKIKALQEEIRNATVGSKKPRNTYADDSSSKEWLSEQRPAMSQTHGSYSNRSESELTDPRPGFPNSQASPIPQQIPPQRRDPAATSPFNFRPGTDSPNRPSAASIRELNHSRRHSAVDFPTTPNLPANPIDPNPPSPFASPPTNSPHKKTPSLDRNWTMGAISPLANGRPLTTINAGSSLALDRSALDSGHKFSGSRDIDRGYASGGEVDGKKSRNVLRKRETMSASHSRQSSYQGETKRPTQMASRRQSRFGSVDSIKDTVAAMTAPASKMYHGNGISIKSHFRNNSASDSNQQSPSTSDITSPTVTKLDYDARKPSMKLVTSSSTMSSGPSTGSPKSANGPPKTSTKQRISLRAISDAVTGNEKANLQSPVSISSPIKEAAKDSPARTGSTTPSGTSQNLDRESTDASSKGTSVAHTGLTPTSGTRRKSKKETSAYVRGLEQKSPQEQMKGCDYSGWMKKKSSNLMTSWKPRLFVLRGRRLSYYYSENDVQEKGLIDISSHRVLPADSDILAGIHATVTGAKSSPVSPATAHTPTMASQDAASQPEPTDPKSNSEATFIFKLVPPRSGLSRAVNFTKPTVHYFAVDNIRQGRLWMAALMKATIDRDETKPMTTTYQQKTISLAKARALRHRPPALMGLDEKHEARDGGPKSDETGLAIQGLDLDQSASGVEHQRAGSLDAAIAIDPSEQEEIPVST